MATKSATDTATPDRRRLTTLQAQRFAESANIPVKEIEGRSIAEITEALKWRVDPELLLFRRVCGQVVRWDAASGLYQPVPFATVHVMDADCDFLGYFPPETRLSWLYPIWCYEEEITSVVTDACGKFCVWIPRFDIDWVVRWRFERYCYPEVFVPLDLGRLLGNIGLVPQPSPGPDPGPVELRQSGLALEQLAGVVGRETASKLLLGSQSAGFGARKGTLESLLRQPAYRQPVPPPASAKLLELRQRAKDGDGLRGLVRGRAGREYKLDLDRYVGPFPLWHCEWVLKEELVPILDVPDITFLVTQDTDGDGDQETIYSDGWFGVGWRSGPLEDVILHASPIARINGSCEVPTVGDCEQPEITHAGLMPATDQYIDMSATPARGHGRRVNPPHADGQIRQSVFPPLPTPDTPADAPFTGTIQLYGCNTLQNGEYYRLLYSYNGAAPVPFTGRSWWLDPFPGPGAPLHVTPDAQGWYPVLHNPDAWFPPHELLDWPTTAYPDGLYDITIQIGDAGKNVIFTSATVVPISVDNSATQPLILSLSWRVLPSGGWNTFPNLICPIVHRPPGQDVEFRVEYQVSAAHLLKTAIGSSGCGGGVMLPSPEPNALPYQHWHTSAADNFVSQAATFVLPGSALPGCYGFTVNGYSRAFNPAGGDPSDPQVHDWYIDASWLNWNQASVSVAVVDA